MMTLRVGSGKVHSLAFAPGGRALAVGAGSNCVFLFDWPTGRELRQLSHPVHASCACKGLAFSPDGSELAGRFSDGRVVVWQTDTGRAVAGHPGPDPLRAWSGPAGYAAAVWWHRPSGAWVAWVGDRGFPPTARLVRLDTKQPVGAVRAYGPPAAGWWDADGRLVAWGAASAVVYELPAGPAPEPEPPPSLWLRVARRVGLALGPPDPMAVAPAAVYDWPRCPGAAVAPYPDGRSVVLGGERGVLRRCDLATGAERACWRLPVAYARSAAVAPDRTVAAAGLSNGRVVVWDLD